jgi:sterol desaturase/sphingolipid hydroxylase (fatty acid hydroxylase superfamily)
MPSIYLQIFIGLPVITLVFRLLEQWRPLTRQRLFRRDWKVDVAYYALGCILSPLSSAGSLAAMVFLRRETGLEFGHIAGSQPGWLQLLEIIATSDLLGYLFHRLLHSNRWLWRFHKVHHSSLQMDWLAAARLHPVDKLLGDFVQLTPLLCLGFGDGPLFAYASILGFQMFLIHSNIRVDFGALRWLIASPAFHHWHHCDDPHAYNKNFAPHLVILDRLFGTAYLPANLVQPERYGSSEAIPDGFLQQLIHPFQKGLTRCWRIAKFATPESHRPSSHGTKVQLLVAKSSYEIRVALLFALWTRRHFTM